MNAEMQRLLAEAQVLAGGQHQCVVLGHKWESQGGRICPRGDDMGGGPCSQTVYVCGSCGLEDYGQPGGPAHDECFKFGPCDRRCIPDEIREDSLACGCEICRAGGQCVAAMSHEQR